MVQANDEHKPFGGLDSTVVTGATGLDKRRISVAIADPYVLGAQLRFALVDGVYRIPTSNPLISDALVVNTSKLQEIRDFQQELRQFQDEMLTQLKLMNLYFSRLVGEELTEDDIEGQ